MNDADRRDRNRETLRNAFAGIARGDAAAMLEDYHDDLVLELPYATPDEPLVVSGKQAVLEYLTRAFGVFRFSLEIVAEHLAADPNMLILEYLSSGEVLTTGKPYRNRYIALYWFDDAGKVLRVREFYNPVPSIEALSPD